MCLLAFQRGQASHCATGFCQVFLISEGVRADLSSVVVISPLRAFRKQEKQDFFFTFKNFHCDETMQAYCSNQDVCRRMFIIQYFDHSEQTVQSHTYTCCDVCEKANA